MVRLGVIGLGAAGQAFLPVLVRQVLLLCGRGPEGVRIGPQRPQADRAQPPPVGDGEQNPAGECLAEERRVVTA